MRRLRLLCVLFLLPAILCSARAHPGMTDASGGHRDSANVSNLGFYHYHCDGHPAHLHLEDACPYQSARYPGETPVQYGGTSRDHVTVYAQASLSAAIAQTLTDKGTGVIVLSSTTSTGEAWLEIMLGSDVTGFVPAPDISLVSWDTGY